jgi:hypothetical protein
MNSDAEKILPGESRDVSRGGTCVTAFNNVCYVYTEEGDAGRLDIIPEEETEIQETSVDHAAETDSLTEYSEACRMEEIEDEGGGSDSGDSDILETTGGATSGCYYSRSCAFCLYIGLGLLVLGCVVSLVLLTALVVLPYAKVSSFRETECLALNVARRHADRDCSCGRGCHSSHLCVQLLVKYEPEDTPSPVRATMYENEAALSREVSTIMGFQKVPLGGDRGDLV